MKKNKNILRAALLLLLVIAAPGARAQKLITANTDGTYTITMPDHNVKVTADVKKLLTHKDISVSIPSQEWTGSELAPVITVTDGTTTLNEGTDYTVTAPSGKIQDASDYTFTINGAGNYSGTKEATFTIAPKPVTVSGITVDEKTYDGTTNATLNYANVNFNGRCGEDDLTVTATGTFTDANAGEGKEVAISHIALGGTSAANYVLADQGQQTSATASITKATPVAGDFVFSAPTDLSYPSKPG